MTYSGLVMGWALYGAIHSVLASATVKSFAFRWPWLKSTYRIWYVLIASIGLVLLLLANGMIHEPNWFDSVGLVRYASLMLSTFGVLLIRASFRHYRLRAFLGFSPEEEKLVTTGILQHIRHPLYAGTILLIISFFLFIPNLPTLVTCLCMTTYLFIGMWLEERRLIHAYGETYRLYRQSVPALIPKLRR